MDQHLDHAHTYYSVSEYFQHIYGKNCLVHSPMRPILRALHSAESLTTLLMSCRYIHPAFFSCFSLEHHFFCFVLLNIICNATVPINYSIRDLLTSTASCTFSTRSQSTSNIFPSTSPANKTFRKKHRF